MVENSLVIQSMVRLWAFIGSIYEHSLIKCSIDRLFTFVSDVFRHSVLYPLLTYRHLNSKDQPFFMKILKSIYGSMIGNLHGAYCRGRDHSKVVQICSKAHISKWIDNSRICKAIGSLLDGTTLEGLMIGVFVFIVPFAGKVLSLVAAFGLFLLFILTSIVRDNRRFTISKGTVLAFFYFIMITINSFLSINPGGSMRDLGIHAGGLLVMFTIINSPLKKKDFSWMFNFIALAGLIVSIYAVYQYIVGVPMGSGWVDTSQNIGLTVRVFGTFENPNIFAEFLIMSLPLVIARGLQNISERKYLSGMAFCIPAGAMVVALLMTASRAGWLGFAFGMVVLVLLINMKFIIPMAFGGVAMIPLLPESILQRIGTIGSLSDSSNLYRYNLWKSSYEIIHDFFVTGIGTGYLAFRTITPYYMKNMAPYHSHNTYIQTMVEFGLVGLLIFLAWCFILFKEGADAAIKSTNFTAKVYGAALTAGFCSVLLHGMAEHILYYSKIMLWFWIFVGLIIKVKELNEVDYE
jgi:O-antigen ligase